MIEYNGEQHYRAYNRTNTWNTPENLQKVQKRDEEKRRICKHFKISLYEISYQKFDFLEEIVYNILVEINEI
nr:MAG TPA: restriction enzyme [Caudoviricetes sp.]